MKKSFAAAVLTGALVAAGGTVGCAVYLVVESFSLRDQLNQANARLSEIDRRLERFEQVLPRQPLP